MKKDPTVFGPKFGADSPEVADEVMSAYREGIEQPSGRAVGVLFGWAIIALAYCLTVAALGFAFYGVYRLFALLVRLY